MRRTLAPLTLAALAVAALTGCVIAPPMAGSDFGFVPAPATTGYDDYEIDAAEEARWQEEHRSWELDFAAQVADELRAAGSQLAPGEGESLEVFRHVVIGVGYEWCERLYLDDGVRDDPAAHAELAQRYGWTTDDYRIVAEASELSLCGY
ncbi:hypothetical protein [Agrococcus sp. HG114]|uniref:hypothetical protein n=1 Tax=Agrococcus sp. HG114 TaxID=2969757 RepID=UPI00215B5F55|nr:hypothetical protein [Agrococcus sp. HG114]MCR8670504.1 hypothetical protein [Agrococcus sp. HG114]